jgi:uncharacterized protein (DUF2147 family)
LIIIRSTHSGKKLVSLAVWLLLFAASGTFHAQSIAAAADTPQSAGKIDEQRLLGHWVRPDGGYILELKEIGKDGTLKAAYFNPRPINVARADWKRKQGVITVAGCDVNYRAQYDLQYGRRPIGLKERTSSVEGDF